MAPLNAEVAGRSRARSPSAGSASTVQNDSTVDQNFVASTEWRREGFLLFGIQDSKQLLTALGHHSLAKLARWYTSARQSKHQICTCTKPSYFACQECSEYLKSLNDKFDTCGVQADRLAGWLADAPACSGQEAGEVRAVLEYGTNAGEVEMLKIAAVQCNGDHEGLRDKSNVQHRRRSKRLQARRKKRDSQPRRHSKRLLEQRSRNGHTYESIHSFERGTK